jgi:molybdopterin-guanine dinucleotide biosynthesis protein A
LGGICAALASTQAPWAVFIPIDLPFLPASLVDTLLRNAQITFQPITLASIGGFAQTFPVLLRREVLAPLQSELDVGRAGCFKAFQAAAARLGAPLSVIPVEILLQAGQVHHPADLPAHRWFLNLNTEPDLHRAETQLASHSPATQNQAPIA